MYYMGAHTIFVGFSLAEGDFCTPLLHKLALMTKMKLATRYNNARDSVPVHRKFLFKDTSLFRQNS